MPRGIANSWLDRGSTGGLPLDLVGAATYTSCTAPAGARTYDASTFLPG